MMPDGRNRPRSRWGISRSTGSRLALAAAIAIGLAIEAENSMGFHADQEAARVLARSIDYARRGQIVLAGGDPGEYQVTPRHGTAP